MIKDREYSFIAEEEGRVDIVGVNALNIPLFFLILQYLSRLTVKSVRSQEN